MYELNRLSVEYKGHVVLKNVSIHIKQGEKVAVIGESGSGKSTLLRHLYQLAPSKTAWCPQALGLVPMLSSYHNIYMGSLSRRSRIANLLNFIKPKRSFIEEVKQIANDLQIDESLLFKPTKKLSGGQQQRTAIARSLYQQSPVFIGDEPVSAVDELRSQKIIELIFQKHATVICALHDRDLALKYFNRIIGIKAGEVMFDVSVENICNDQIDSLYQD